MRQRTHVPSFGFSLPPKRAVGFLALLVATAAAAGSNTVPPPLAPPAETPAPPEATTAATGPEAVFCPVCGARNRIGSRFCRQDGSPLPTLDPALEQSSFTRDPSTYSPEEIQESVQRVSQSVVRILVKGNQVLKYPVILHPDHLRDRQAQLESVEGEARLAGSGFVVGRGEIVTNAHVASPFDAPAQITIETLDGRSFPARLRGVDHASDLALLQVDVTTPPILEWGNSDDLHLGSDTWAIGNPLDLGISVTRGTIATLARVRVGLNQVESFVHSDASITHGNSGGPLVDALGRVVGVSDMGFSDDRGQGYSISSGMARLVIERLRKSGKYDRGFLGLHVRQVDADSVAKHGLKRASGVVVESVLKATPAESAGFHPGDVLFGINGRQATSSYLLQEAVSSVGPGAALVITIDRGGQVMELRITTALRPVTPRIDPLLDLQNYMMVRFEEDAKHHDVVVRVPAEFSPAPRFGFHDGDVLESALSAQDWKDEPITLDDFNKKKGHSVSIGTLADLRTALGRMYLGGRVGVAFLMRHQDPIGLPIAAVAYDETWPIVL